MTFNCRAGGLLSGRRSLRLGAVFLAVILVGVACFMVWHYLRGGELREDGVVEARLIAPKEAWVSSCFLPPATGVALGEGN